MNSRPANFACDALVDRSLLHPLISVRRERAQVSGRGTGSFGPTGCGRYRVPLAIGPLAIGLLFAFIFTSQSTFAWVQDQQPSRVADNALPPLLKQVGIDQRLGAQIPADLIFKDESGKPVHLGEFFGQRPLVLCLVYYGCPQLCTTVLNEFTGCLNAMPTSIGEQFDVLTISFDPRENDRPGLAAEKKKQYVRQYGRPHANAGWHFLTGDEANIRQITRAVGFRYVWDPASKQYFHASGLMVLTPNGVVSKYFYGITYAPQNIRLALVEAADEKTGSFADAALLFCFHYDPNTGHYTLAVLNLLKAAGVLTVMGLGLLLYRGIRSVPRDPKVAAGFEPVQRH